MTNKNYQNNSYLTRREALATMVAAVSSFYLPGCGSKKKHGFVPGQQNTAPTLVDLANDQATEGISYSRQISATDDGLPLQPNGSNAMLKYSMTGAPNSLSIDENLGTISGVPKFGDARDYAVSVNVTDGQLTTTKAYLLTVKPGQQQPYNPPAPVTSSSGTSPVSGGNTGGAGTGN